MNGTIRKGIAVTAMALMATTVFAKDSSDRKATQQSWDQVIEQMNGEGITLSEAISKATDQVGGEAISARAVKNFKDKQDSKRYKNKKASTYCIEVLCRTDKNRFKVVTINGRNGKILGTSSASPASETMGYQARSENRSSRDWQSGEDTFTVMQLIKYSEIEDTTIVNHADEELGYIWDFAIDPSNGQVSYAAVSFGGWLGMGDKLFAIPMSALHVTGKDRIILDVTKQELKTAKGFNQENWPTHPSSRWMKDQDKQKQDRSRKITSIVKASDLIDLDVKGAQDEELGEINDLYIDPDDSRVAYSVLSHGGWMGISDELIAIPWESLDMKQRQDNENLLTLDMPKSRLENAPSASESDQDTWNNPDWVEDVYDYFEVDPYWHASVEIEAESSVTKR